jgi:mannose-6-phosphate isomerase-like protein (cupin superfamily)
MKGVFVLALLSCAVACARDGQPTAAPAEPPALEPLGHHGRVGMARIRLGPDESMELAASRCQDVLLFVEQGSVRSSLGEATTVSAGRAMRVSAPATFRANPRQGAVLFAVAVLSDAASASSVDWRRAPVEDACPMPSAVYMQSDPARSGPFVHAAGRLRVMIYLDASGAGRPGPSLGTLEGDPRLGVPEHLHEESAEVLWIQDGAGAMRIGQEMRPIRPGTFAYVPPKTIHGFEPDGTHALFAYQVYVPSGPEQRFRRTVP